MPCGGSQPLFRVGVITEDPAPAWAAYLLEQLRRDHRFSLRRLTRCALDRQGKRSARSPVFALYEALDRRLFRAWPDALARIPLAAVLHDAPDQDAETHSAGPGEIPDLDLVLDLTSGSSGRGFASAVEFGVWQYDHGDGWSTPTGEAFLVPEMLRASATVTTALRCHRESHDGGSLLYRSHAARDRISLYRNRNAACWKAAQFVLRRLEELCRGRSLDEIIDSVPVDSMDSAPGSSAQAPRRVRLIPYAARVLIPAARIWLRRRFTREEWVVAIKPRGEGLPTSESLNSARLRYPPRDRFYADPWIVESPDHALVFLEEYVRRLASGAIAVAEIDRQRGIAHPRTVLRRPYHLSYPCVFEHDGLMYMVPSSERNRTVDLYRAQAYPAEWEKVATLLEGEVAFDPTITHQDGRFWMWTCIAPHGSEVWDELFVFHSQSLTSGWKSHPLNPVVSDARRARPAGAPFLHQGRLIRPSQSSVPHYGAHLVLNEVELMTPAGYRERPIAVVNPPSSMRAVGIHTFVRTTHHEVFDVARWVSPVDHLRLGRRDGRESLWALLTT